MLTIVCWSQQSSFVTLWEEKLAIMITKDSVLIRFGQKVQELRKAQHLSQEQLADLAGVHRTYIGMIERAEKNITLRNISKIADALKIEIKDLF